MDLVIVILIIGWAVFSSLQKKNTKKTGKQPYHPHQRPAAHPSGRSPLFTKGELSGEPKQKMPEEDMEGISTEGEDPCHSENFVSMEGIDPCHPEETPGSHGEEHQTENADPDNAYEIMDTLEDQGELQKEALKGIVWGEILNRKY